MGKINENYFKIDSIKVNKIEDMLSEDEHILFFSTLLAKMKDIFLQCLANETFKIFII